MSDDIWKPPMVGGERANAVASEPLGGHAVAFAGMRDLERPSEREPQRVAHQERGGVRRAPGFALSPRGSRVVVLPAAQEERMESGIVLPQTSRKRNNEGQVVAIGPHENCDDLQVGDVVLFLRWASYEVTVEGVSYFQVDESDIVAVVDAEKADAVTFEGLTPT